MRETLAAHIGRAHVVGITGPAGAGKSTLVNALVGELLARGHKVAIVAVDPSSPFTGGAVLGDRIRMAEHQADERVFIRSLAARGHAGGVSRATAQVIDVLDAAGFDLILVETVGAGQSDVAIAKLARTRIVVYPPGLGDEVQALKAGVLEIADILVVNKADLPGAERTARDLLAMPARRGTEHKRPVLKTVVDDRRWCRRRWPTRSRHTKCSARRWLSAWRWRSAQAFGVSWPACVVGRLRCHSAAVLAPAARPANSLRSKQQVSLNRPGWLLRSSGDAPKAAPAPPNACAEATFTWWWGRGKNISCEAMSRQQRLAQMRRL